MFERELEENGYTFIGTTLIFTSHIKEDIVPTIAPIIGQTFAHAMRTLGEQKEFHIAANFHHLPSLSTPLIGFLNKKIGRHAHTYQFTAFDLVISVTIFLQWIVKRIFSAKDLAGVDAALLIKEIHVAMFAAFTDFCAAVPRVPNIVHELVRCFGLSVQR
jgi:hypothetical protein